MKLRERIARWAWPLVFHNLERCSKQLGKDRDLYRTLRDNFQAAADAARDEMERMFEGVYGDAPEAEKLRLRSQLGHPLGFSSLALSRERLMTRKEVFALFHETFAPHAPPREDYERESASVSIYQQDGLYRQDYDPGAVDLYEYLSGVKL